MDVLPWVYGGSAFLLMLALTPIVITAAHHFNWLAYPKKDRWHQKPTALMGGIAIYCATTLALIGWGMPKEVGLFWTGATIMFVAGLVDDFKTLRPITKLLLQVVATVFLISAGYQFGPNWPIWIAIPLTFFWVIGITNALNLLDNMDGLAAGIAAIASIVLAIFALLEQHVLVASLALSVAGASLGFLVFNFNPARIFMGDSGSLFLGYSTAGLILMLQAETSSVHGWGIYLGSIALLAVPIFDTTLVSVMRTLTGRSVSQGGRDHTSHRLVFLGFSERQAVLFLYFISMAFGSIGLLLHFLDVTVFYALLILGSIAAFILWVHLSRANVYGSAEELEQFYNTTIESRIFATLHSILGTRWKAVLGLAVDLFIISASFILAYHLRFDRGITSAHLEILQSTLPLLVVVKLVVFYACGLYRSIWRYTGTAELLRIATATIVASVASFLLLAVQHGTGQLALGVLLIDWMIVTLAISASRLGFRGLHQFTALIRQDGYRLIICGAGGLASLCLREVQQNAQMNYLPVGLLDDDPLKQGMRVQGLPVLGTLDNLADVCKQNNATHVIIAISAISPAKRDFVFQICRDIGITCYVFHLGIKTEVWDSYTGDGGNEPHELKEEEVSTVLY